MDLQQPLSVENVTVTASVDKELDLSALVLGLGSSECELDRDVGLTYQPDGLETTAVVYRSGKVVCMGAQSVATARASVGSLLTRLNTLGIDVPADPDVPVTNIVFSALLRGRLDLNAVAVELGLEHIEYEPEQFSALIYRPERVDVVVLMFGSGSVIITGGTDDSHARLALDALTDKLTASGHSRP
ncbi:TATA-box-binding protein [Haloplanus natans]|uniref:TATA-box-binding protein n=1 Tax=Haloplanus natans TaxID=376171 RepID=UPI0006778319|nr:TATA-box-binding protein [Haloplanus natans]